jgi:hypothetical protein
VALQYRGTGTHANANGTGSTSVATTLPTGWQPGDALWLSFMTNNTVSVTFSQTGTGAWTQDFTALVGAHFAYSFWHRIMQAGDGAPTINWGTSQVWAWACGGLYSDIGAPLSVDVFGTGDPLQITTAATAFTADPATPTLGPNTASVILTAGSSSAQATISSHTWTPPAGWTVGIDDMLGYASRATTWAGHCYRLSGVGPGTVTPGSSSITNSAGQSLYMAVAQALVHEAVPGLLPQQLSHRAPALFTRITAPPAGAVYMR